MKVSLSCEYFLLCNLAHERRILVIATQTISQASRSMSNYGSNLFRYHAVVIFKQFIFHMRAADEKLKVSKDCDGICMIHGFISNEWTCNLTEYSLIHCISDYSLHIRSVHGFNRQMPSLAHAIYFWFSLIFLIARTLAVSLYSAGIYDASKEPIDVLRSVPHGSWSMDVQRFAEEVIHGKVALSGMQFFYLTRQLILSVRNGGRNLSLNECGNYVNGSFCEINILGCRHNCHVRTGLVSILSGGQERKATL